MAKVKSEKSKEELEILNSTRPDLEIVSRLPGAYIVKNGVSVPDLNDEAMMNREKSKVKGQMPIEKLENEKTSHDSQDKDEHN